MPEPQHIEFPEWNWHANVLKGTPAVQQLIWLLQVSGVAESIFLPQGKVDLPEAGYTSPLASGDLPPPGRYRLLWLDGMPQVIDSTGAVVWVAGGGSGGSMDTLHVDPANFAYNSTTPTIARTYTMPGGTLASVGDRLCVRVEAILDGGMTGTPVLEVRIGGINMTTALVPPTAPITAGIGLLDLELAVRTIGPDINNVVWHYTQGVPGPPVQANYVGASQNVQDLSAAQIIDLRVASGSAGDFIQIERFIVERKLAP